MNYLLFDSLPDELPLVEPEFFRYYTDYAYDPTTEAVDPDTTPVMEYWASFLVPSADLFTQIRAKLLTQLADYRQGIVNRLPVTVVSDRVLGEYDGTHSVFWVLEPDWYTRLGSEEFIVTLHGYGSPLASTSGSITQGQSFSVAENVPPGYVIGTVVGFTPDLTLEGRPDQDLAYDPTTGTLSVAKALDYETTDEYSLTIGGTEVVVYVLDSIENPVPEQPEYTFYLKPDDKPGTKVGQVLATPQGSTGVVPRYTLSSGNSGNNFAIDTYSGEITLLSLAGITSGHILTVNYGVVGESITCTLQLLNSEGSLILPEYRFNLTPNPPANAVIGTFTDALLQYQVSAYEVQVNSSRQLIVTDSRAEALATIGVVEYQVSATHTVTGATGEFTTYVNIYDPSLITAYQEFWIPVDTTNGGAVGQVQIPNIDPEVLPVVFSIATPGTPLSINTQTGELLVTQATLLTPGTITLVVNANRVSDGSLAGYRNTRVVVYDVAEEFDLQFTVSPTATVGTVVGELGTGLTLTSGSLGTFALNLTTGTLTVAQSPPSSANFEVTNGEGDTTAVQVTVTDSPGGDSSEYLGAVFAGQSGQSIAQLSNIRYSVGSVGFGSGSLTLVPDPSGNYSRTIAGTIVVNRQPGFKLTISSNVTTDMLEVLRGYWTTAPVTTQYTVSIKGKDWSAYLVEYQESHSDVTGVQLTLTL
jgi:hypothetical protein